MVHLAPTTRGRRRLDVIVGGILAVLGVVVAVLAVAALNHPKGREAAKTVSATSSRAQSSSVPAPSSSTALASSSTTATSATSTKSASASVTSATGVKAVPLIVLNSTTQTGLAATAAKTFQAGGWTVTSSGNIVNDIASTCAYYDPSDPKNQVAATALMAQFPAIKRIKEKFTGLPAGPIVVVLTSDYS